MPVPTALAAWACTLQALRTPSMAGRLFIPEQRACLGSLGPVAGPRRPFPLCLSKARLPLRSCCQSALLLRAFFLAHLSSFHPLV